VARTQWISAGNLLDTVPHNCNTEIDFQFSICKVRRDALLQGAKDEETGGKKIRSEYHIRDTLAGDLSIVLRKTMAMCSVTMCARRERQRHRPAASRALYCAGPQTRNFTRARPVAPL